MNEIYIKSTVGYSAYTMILTLWDIYYTGFPLTEDATMMQRRKYRVNKIDFIVHGRSKSLFRMVLIGESQC